MFLHFNIKKKNYSFDIELEEEIFMGHHITEIFENDEFDRHQSSDEKDAWYSFIGVVKVV